MFNRDAVLSSTRIIPLPLHQSTWLHRWIYYLASGFLFGAAALRAFLIFQDAPFLGLVLLVLAGWLALFIGDNFLAHRLVWSTAVFITAEAGLIMLFLLTTEQDFFACLFAILGMQAMHRYSPRVVGALMSISALLIFGALLERIGLLQALALALVYTALGAFMTAYIWSTRRAEVSQEQEQKLLEELQVANRRLEFHARQQEQLAAGRERQRLARELHDSVTQTIFSMTLTTRSALLLLDCDPSQVAGQLDRLNQLSQSAMSEMQELILRLAPQAVSGGGLVSTLQHHVEECRRMHNLEVTLEVDGSGLLDPAEEASLFRIAQEALNNVMKHAGVSRATIRLHLSKPAWMEVDDSGIGFDPQRVPSRGRMGLAGMRERAAEIDWCLQMESKPGAGTRIRVEQSIERGK
jgi:signal transduction histidine kinase